MLTLRARLTLGLLALITVLVLGLAVLENVALRGFLVEGEASRVRARSTALIDAAARTDLDTGHARALATALTSADTGALVLDPDGSLLGTPWAGTIGAPPPSDLPVAAVARAADGGRGVHVVRDTPAGRERLAFVPEPGSTPPRAVIVLATPLTDDDAVARQQFLTGLVGLVVVLVLAGVGSMVLVRRTLRPLGRISRTAAQVAAGDLGRRVRLGGPLDEVGLLAASFDGMTEALQRSFDELAASERRSREFVADASHELRTPLTTLAGFTDVLLRRPTEDYDATRLLASLRREVDRMQRVVDDLLLLARADQRQVCDHRPVDLRHSVMRVVEQLRPPAGMRSLRVDGGPVRVVSDPDRLHRILLNLVTNALRHTPENGTIVLTTAVDGDRASITVTSAGTVADALAVLRGSRPDLVILDLTLPDRPGLDVLVALRDSGLDTPVIILSARHDVPDRVSGLEAGADDHLTKPFRFEELLARIRAVLRRHYPAADVPVLACGGVRLDTARHEVTVDGAVVDVGGLEFELLELLLHNVGRVLTREVLMDRLWGRDSMTDSNVLEVHVSRLRRRLGAQGPRLIRTIRGVGYVLRAPV